MARTLQAAALPRIEARRLPAGTALAALGIVYGDIGTSALYGFKQAADAAGTLSPETIMGIVSVIVWSLIVIVSFKYAILIMRADNRGEGGIAAFGASRCPACAVGYSDSLRDLCRKSAGLGCCANPSPDAHAQATRHAR